MKTSNTCNGLLRLVYSGGKMSTNIGLCIDGNGDDGDDCGGVGCCVDGNGVISGYGGYGGDA